MTPMGPAAGAGGAGAGAGLAGATPLVGAKGGLAAATPLVGTGANLATPIGGFGLMTPTPGQASQLFLQRAQQELDERNKPMTDDELDALLPSAGYTVIEPPVTYVPIRTPARRLLATPAPLPGAAGTGVAGGSGFMMNAALPGSVQDFGLQQPEDATLPAIKPEDFQYFSTILKEKDEGELSTEEANERAILKLLLKIKNGNPQQRRSALKTITERAREFGPGPLFNQILPLLMSTALEDQERHLLVKVIDRVLYKLDDLVRPYVHKILVVIEPLLIDEDEYARAEGREIISNLAKAAGLAAMIATMRPDIDSTDEFVRNTTARAFSVVASALGIPALLPFLKAVCQSKKSWAARHTGTKIVQQIAVVVGCAVLPHLRSLVEIIAPGLEDGEPKVRTITALAVAALAEAAHPYGFESFEAVLAPLWKGTRKYTGKGLAAFLKAIGYLIPLMEPDHASYYTNEVMVTLLREFHSPDDEIKKIVLQVVKQCVATEGVEAKYVRQEMLPEFLRAFWVRRMALDRRNAKQVIETTVAMAGKAGGAEVIARIADFLKDENEAFRNMVMEAIDQIVTKMGVADIDIRLEELLLDAMLYAFNEQTSEESTVMLNGLGTFIKALEIRAKPYLAQVAATLKWRLNNKSARVRMQAADLISKIAPVLRTCDQDDLLGHLGVVLFEYLGEEYPEVLASILGGLKSIVNVIGMSKMTPPIKDLLPRLTPILKNRQEGVLEQAIDLVGRIADRGAEFVSPKEWLRICFELLDMLKAHKKSIRKAAVFTFGWVAKAIGPQDILGILMNNLKVQERQSRVCSVIAIAVVADACGAFTVLPFLLADYRLGGELNIRTGVLKALSYIFEYIGPTAKHYVYPVVELLEDALTERDLVHRQTASVVVKHIALGVAGLGCEDALIHLLNHVFSNIFETSAHVISAVTEAIEAMRIAVGGQRLLSYVLAGKEPGFEFFQIWMQIFLML